MKHFSLLVVLLLFWNNSISQIKADFAVELAAFDQSVPLAYFKGLEGVYEAYDANQIYRYQMAAQNREEAERILQEAKLSGFPNARIIDFAYIRSVCEAQCGYNSPKITARSGANNTTLPASPRSTNSSMNNNSPNKNNSTTTTKKNISIDAAALLGQENSQIADRNNDGEWIAFFAQNQDLGLSEEELYELYQKHGNIKIEHASWFIFKNNNSDLGASDAELMELFIQHGNIKISEAMWFVFKQSDADLDADFIDFKEKNAELGASDAELQALYQKYGNIKISNAIWFHFKENPHLYDIPKYSGRSYLASNTTMGINTSNAEVQTVGFVLFEFNSTLIDISTWTELEKVAKALLKNENLSVVLIGHADAIGSVERNQELSLKRAGAISKYLIDKGIEHYRIQIDGKGKETPIAINHHNDGRDCPEGRKYNRRVDLQVLDPEGNEVKIVSSISVPEHLRLR